LSASSNGSNGYVNGFVNGQPNGHAAIRAAAKKGVRKQPSMNRNSWSFSTSTQSMSVDVIAPKGVTSPILGPTKTDAILVNKPMKLETSKIPSL
jgi:hypothetical protein